MMYRRYNKHGNHKKNRAARVVIVLLIVCLTVETAAVAFLFVNWKSGSKKIASGNDNVNIRIDTNSDGEDDDDNSTPIIHNSGKTIDYNGSTYEYNENIVSFAFLGVDRRTFGLKDNALGTAGQADVIIIAAYNTVGSEMKFIVVPRESMVDIDTYYVDGGFAGIDHAQICLAYAYGDGRETSCDNMLTSINRLFFGIPISYYACLDLDGIAPLNDAVGGVTLTCIEDFEEFKKGETVTLDGEAAENYVRSRSETEVNADTARRARQKQYIECFASKALKKIKSSSAFAAKLYSIAKKYGVTNVSLDDATYLASTVLTKNVTFDDFTTVPGIYTMGKVYAEYEVNEDALFELILDTYYTKK